MLKKATLILVILVNAVNGAWADLPDTRWIVDVRPASVLLSPDLDGFTVRNAGNTSSETVSDEASWAPSVNVGIGFELDGVDLHLLAGPGYLWNEGFRGGFGQIEAGALFKLAEGRVQVGPHIAVFGLADATWDPTTNDVGLDRVDLDGNIGYKAGLTLNAGIEGIDQLAFLANINYVDVCYDVRTNGGWVAQDDKGAPVTELDMSGLMIELGLMVRF